MSYQQLTKGEDEPGNPFGLGAASVGSSFADPSVTAASGSAPSLPAVKPLIASSLNEITTMYGNKNIMMQECGYFFPLQSLGRGSFGSVSKGIRKEDEEKVVFQHNETGVTFYAVKQCMVGNMFGSKLPHIQMEIRALTVLKGHPNIIRMYSHFAGPSGDMFKPGMCMYFVLELADAGDLGHEVKTEFMRTRMGTPMGLGLPEAKCRFYFRQIAAGINYMHSRCMLHRDLKLENVLLVSDRRDPRLKVCKIADFGLSTIGWTTHDGIIPMELSVGTRRYMAPEYAYHLCANPNYGIANYEPRILPTPTVDPTEERKQPDHMQKMAMLRYEQRVEYVDRELVKLKRTRQKIKLYREYAAPMRVNGHPAEVWTMGVCLFCMITGKYPFVADYYPTGLDLLLLGKFIKYRNIPPVVYDFLKELFEPDPTKRITMRGIMYHRWVNVRDPEFVVRRPRGETVEQAFTPPAAAHTSRKHHSHGHQHHEPQAGTSGVVVKTPSKEKTVVQVHKQKSGEEVVVVTKTPVLVKTPSVEKKTSAGSSAGAGGGSEAARSFEQRYGYGQLGVKESSDSPSSKS